MSFSSHFTPVSLPNLGLVRFPRVAITPEQFSWAGLPPGSTTLQYLKKLAWLGYLDKEKRGVFTNVTRQEAIDRLRMEFEVFTKTGTLGYILLIYDILHWCDKSAIPRGPARGSCAASFAFFCLDITKIDPIRYGLTFTRFISEARVKPKIIDGEVYADGKMVMDVDIDISYLDRGRVIQYVKDTFGGSACGICTVMGISAKMALKNVVKTYLGYDEGEAKRVSDWVEVKFGKSVTLEEARTGAPDLRAWIEASPQNGEAFSIALAISDLAATKGTHPSGLFIGFEPLDGTIPTELSTEDREVVTSYNMEVAALVGIKVDLLGLRNLNVIKNTCDMVGLDFNEIDVNDPAIYSYIAGSKLYNGLFQINTGLTAEAVHKIKPRNIDQLGACLAISRPGAFKYIDDFARFVNEGTFKPIHPAFDLILKDTGNILLYQEQVSAVLQTIYHLSAVEAENMRRIIGKKDRGEELARFEPVLYEKGAANGIPKEVTKYFWDVCNASADYLFNKAHSQSYSYITAYTTFLKAKHLKEFVLCVLKMSRHESDAKGALISAIQECPKLGINVLGPDVTKSGEDFEIDGDGNIRFGLGHIRGISETTVSKLVALKKQFSTRFEIFEAARAAKVPINILTSLIYSGCLDTKGATRSMVALNAQLYNLLTDREKPLIHKLAAEHSEDLIAILKDLPNRKDEKGKPLIRETRLATLRRDYQPYWLQYRHNSGNEELCSHLMERALLGFSYSGTLHGIYSKKVVGLTSITELLRLREKRVAETAAAALAAPEGESAPRAPRSEPFKIVAFITEAKKHISKAKGEPYLKVTLSDGGGEVKCMLYGSQKLEACTGFNGVIPKEDDLVIAMGGFSRDGTMLFLDSLIVQANPVALKASDAQVPV